jgi:hypothetical protein
MSTTLTAAITFACLCGAILFGMRIGRLAGHYLNAETRETVRVAVGLIATMSSLLLGLLVNSAKNSYDTVRSEVIQMAARVTLLDRALSVYGPEAAPVRAQLHTAVEGVIRQIWPEAGAASAFDPREGDAVYAAIQTLSPRDERQGTLKVQAMSMSVELAQLRTLIQAQSLASIPGPLLAVLVLWLVIIFSGFSLSAPSNAAARLALMVSATSVAGAIFVILELDRPFTGLIRISSEPVVSALNQIGK